MVVAALLLVLSFVVAASASAVLFCCVYCYSCCSGSYCLFWLEVIVKCMMKHWFICVAALPIIPSISCSALASCATVQSASRFVIPHLAVCWLSKMVQVAVQDELPQSSLPALKAEKLGIEVTAADARFCKPLDIKLVRQLCENHEFLITLEEGSIGGFGSHVAQFIALDGMLDGRTKWRPIVLPDNYIEHASPKEQLALAGLTGNHIAATALSLLGLTREALLLMC
ncbi:hypothetical protein C3L33_22403, partial [Rhododendron williamsianum]